VNIRLIGDVERAKEQKGDDTPLFCPAKETRKRVGRIAETNLERKTVMSAKA